ncbi:MAG: hypothetical protein ABEJ79_04465 [Halolamina sp.]
MRRRLLRVVLAPVVLPHELAHAVPAWLGGLDPQIAVFPEWEGEAVPLGQFDAVVSESTPSWLIRLVAVAPLPTFLGIAAGLGPAMPANRPETLAFIALLSWWASLSEGDLSVALAPAAVRAAGEFRAPSTPLAKSAPLVVVATVAAVSWLLLS